jgi:hypothetical protein
MSEGAGLRPGAFATSRRVKRLVVAFLAALVFPAQALAGPCGLPDDKPVWIDFAALDVEKVMGRPGIVAAVSTGTYPSRLRAAGATTIYWDMNLRQRVGTTTAPADPAVIEERANRLFVFAASQSNCATPWIALNELHGAGLETPWTPNNAQYRANVLALMRALAARGARPFLLVSQPPYTGSDEAVAWWRAAAQVGDIVRQVYFNATQLYRQGAVVANRRLRIAFRRGVTDFTSIGIPVSKVGLMLGFQSAPGTGGRERLQPRQAWFEVVKWQALSARQVAGELDVATVWSWGWGTFSEAGRDADKPDAACVYLWTRSPGLCDGPAVAGNGFKTSRTEGQLRLPSGVMCRVGRQTISTAAIAQVNRVVQDRDVAQSALLARAAESGVARVSRREIVAAEAAVIADRFGGSRSAYIAALARARANLGFARAVLADQLRRRKIAARLRVRVSSAAIASFYATYGDLLVRTVEAQPGTWWLGGRRIGIAISSYAPQRVFEVATGARAMVRSLAGVVRIRALDDARPLASLSLPQARSAIHTVLASHARSEAVVQWSAVRQQALLSQATCRRDELPQPGGVTLVAYLPFLELSA